jgi:hypothetical protein
VVDDSSGDLFGRPPGTGGEEDVDLGSPSAEPSASIEPTPSSTELASLGPGEGTPVARAPAFPSDLTGFGAVTADTVDEVYGPLLDGVDLDPTTSWFSKGPHTPETISDYTWATSAATEISAVVIINNTKNTTADFQTGFGFGQVTIEVLRAGEVVLTTTYPLEGDPDPQLVAELPPGTVGDTVHLALAGHESLDCGGFGELLVLGPGWQSDLAATFGLGPGA